MLEGPPAANAAADQTAAPTSLDELRRRMLGFAIKLVWNRDDAEEIVQDAFQLSLTKGPAVTDPALAPWLYRTVTNLCLNQRRRRPPQPLADWLDPQDATSPSDAVERAESIESLRAAIGNLPDQQRIALILRNMQQMDYNEIAQVMQLSVAAVRTHVHLARRALANKLGGSQ